MNFSLDIVDWCAIAPGLDSMASWQTWAQNPPLVDADARLAKPQALPMMAARRLTSGSRLASECGVTLLERQSIDAIVFTSRHGELERNLRMSQALARGESISPTDFAMSVHNATVGNLTIMTRRPLVTSSLAAGVDSFQQGLIETLCLLQAGYQQVLLVDFDGLLPDFYQPWLPEPMPAWPYATGLVIRAGDTLHCHYRHPADTTAPVLPQSLQFLHGWLGERPGFTVHAAPAAWEWQRR